MNVKEKTSFSVKNSFQMFDRICHKYDRLNRLISLGLDKKWRRALTEKMPPSIEHWLDGATGTGDQILFSYNKGIQAKKITGIDLSQGMLEIGKIKLSHIPNLELQNGSLTAIPLADASCDLVTCSFGVRNVDPFTQSLAEFYRVLKSGGVLLILESSTPAHPWLAKGHQLYMQWVLPKLAWIMGSDPKAYTYLADTTSKFPCGKAFCQFLSASGFIHVDATPMTWGSVTLYYAQKP